MSPERSSRYGDEPKRRSLALEDLSIGVPTVARVYDVMLGGKDNFAVDREVAEASLAVMPELKEIALHNRRFLRRVVRLLTAEEGIVQFLDLGSGLPMPYNTHQMAQEVRPEARVVYVDVDPIVLAHGRAILAKDANTRVVTADIREPRQVLEHPDTRALIDFDRPVCVLLCGVLHHLSDSDGPYGAVAALRDGVAPGSFFAITNFTRLSDMPASAELERVLLRRLGSGRVRTPEELRRFFDGLELLAPGLVPLPLWRPEEPVTDTDSAAVQFMTGGVGRSR